MGNLPAGLSLNVSTGVILGTPTALGASTFTIQLTSPPTTNASCTQIKIFSIVVTCPTVSFVALAPANGVVGTFYSLITGSTNGASFTYSVLPALPAGLALNTTTGIISGIPTTITASTTYVMTAIQSGVCNSSTSQNYTFAITENPTTTLDNSLSNLVKISPNPSNGDFVVDFSDLNVAKSLVRVYDTQGKQVLSSENNANLKTISLGNMPNGIYLLEIETAKGRILKRLAKN